MNEWSEKLKIRLPAIVLLAVTLLFWGFYDRYESSGPVMIDGPELEQSLRMAGPVVKDESIFHLKIVEGDRKPDVRFLLPNAADYDFVRVEGRIRTAEVVRGKHSWNSARLIIIQRDEKGKWIPASHGLLYGEGSSGWSFRRDEFEIMPETVFVELVMEVKSVSGEAWFDSVKAYPVRVKKSWSLFRLIFSTGWIVLGILYFKRCRLDRRKLRYLISLNAVAVIVGCLMPSDWIDDSSQWAEQQLTEVLSKQASPAPGVGELTPADQKALEKPEKKASEPVEKESKVIARFNQVVDSAHRAGHFLLFGSLCFLVYMSAALEHQHPRYYLKVAFDLFLFSAIAESLQHLTIDRTAGISDWLLDVSGMASAFVVFLIVLLLAKLMRVSAFDLSASHS